MLTMVLAVAICTAEGDRICSYLDVTQRLEVQNDQACYSMADQANARSLETGAAALYACISPGRFLELSGLPANAPAPSATF